MFPHRLLLAAVAAVLVLAASPQGQLRVTPIEGQGGKLQLELLLRRLGTVGTFMMTTAHPDDENNALLAQMSYGEGMRTVLVSATRGDGGQNEIGPELFDALAVLRTEELLAAHRFDGAEQYFTRAVDFGYSFSIEESFDEWGREQILGDFVRHIRSVRPDVIAGFVFDGAGGGQHHQASARLSLEAFRAAAAVSHFPEQIDEGLRPWQAKKYYTTTGVFGGGFRFGAEDSRACRVDSDIYDPVLGRTYAAIGAEARSMHKCQGMTQLLALPGPNGRTYTLRDTVIPGQMEKSESTLFDGIDTTLASLAAFAGTPAAPRLTSAIRSIESRTAAARGALRARGPAATTSHLLGGLADTKKLRADLPSLGLSDAARHEIDFRLLQKQQQFEQAIVSAQGFQLEALADDGLVTPGQSIKVTVVAPNRGAAPVTVTRLSFLGFDAQTSACEPGTVAPGASFNCEATVVIPANAKPTDRYFRRLPDVARYVFEPDVPFGAPFRPTPFRVAASLDVNGTPIPISRPVQFRYEDIVAGEKRHELKVVPPFAVQVTREIAIVPLRPAAAGAQPREIRVTVLNGTKGAASAEAALLVANGWNATPAAAPVKFAREGDAVTVRFTVTPPVNVTAGPATIKAIVRDRGKVGEQGYEVVEYPHITRRHVLRPAEVLVQVLDVTVPPNLTVGYVMGVGDQVLPALEQLGARVELIDADTLAWGDLSRFDAIVTGVRAYERRPDLRGNNHRLLDYATRGGTVIVQYNKFEFNEAQYGPYPAKVSSNRITDERAPVSVLIPQHPVFNTPNRIDASAWSGWVQERGLYFLGEKDPRYVDLIEMTDPFPYNPGPKRGALVEAQVGQGRWLYVGLGLWRQLPAGTEGAYKLMANLISLSKTSKSATSAR